MRKTLVCFAAVIAALCFSACTFGSLSPAKSNSLRATLSLGIGALKADSDGTVSRAVVQGGGYLYIRTIGGPTGSSGPFYGPYQVSSGGTFSTEDIPAGSYSMIGFLYSATELDLAKQITIGGAAYTFRQLMTLDDSRFNLIMNSGNDTLGDFFAGQVSGEKVDSVVLTAGGTTSVRVTLIPFTGPSNMVDVSSSPTKTISSPTAVTREFYELYGLSGSSGATISCAISPSSGSATVNRIALYDGDGKLLASTTGSMLPASITGTLASGDRAYLYIEYQASSLNLSFTGSAINGFTFNFTGNASFAGKKLFFGVYDVTGISIVADGGPQGTLAGFGLITLDSGGSGSAQAYSTTDFTQFSPAIPDAGKTYLVTAYVDMNGAYSTISSMSNLSAALMDAIEPNHGDYATSTAKTVTAPSRNASCSLNAGDLALTSAYTYYVTNSGSGTGASGLSTCTLASAITKANADGADSKIKLLENVSLSTSMTVSSALAIYSSGSARKTVTLSGSNVSLSFVMVDSSSTLTLYHVGIDGTGMTMDSGSNVASPILLKTGSTLELDGDTLISNIASTFQSGCSTGSAIYVNGGSVEMKDSAIMNCSNTGNTTSGGAVYVGSGSFTMNGTSKIGNCTASNYGGGIYLSSGTLNMFGTSKISNCSSSAAAYGGGIDSEGATVTMNDSACIESCSAGVGGGIYSTGTLTLSGTSSIVSCSAHVFDGGGGCGGGIGESDGTVSLTESASITGCTADTYGGGVYTGSGNLSMSGMSSISACKVPSGTGSGGGLFIENGSLDMIGTSTIFGCSANQGGGVRASYVGYLNLAETISITRNNATTDGGGVYTNVAITGSSAGIHDNTAGTLGREEFYQAP